MADTGRKTRGSEPYQLLLTFAVSAGNIIQLPNGKVGRAMSSGAIGDTVSFETTGVFPVTKTAGVVFLPGGRVFWDHSANATYFCKRGDRDFYIGRSVGGAASADTEMSVDLNDEYRADIDLLRDAYLSVPVGTKVVGAFGYPLLLGGALQFELDAQNEAQKVDALSVDSFHTNANAIIEYVFRVPNDGASGTQDISLGIANATHASNADTITEALLFHLDGNLTAINLQSRDGVSAAVANTDTTKDYAEGSALTNRKELWIDMRDPADCQCYVDGVLVLSASVFRIDQGAGTWYLLIHLEKEAGTDVYVLVVDRAEARFAEQ